MLLTLYDQYGIVKTTLSPNDTSTQDKEIQGDNVLSLSFTLYEYVSIDVNDYVDFEGERYWAVEKYLPQEKSTVEWEYNVKLYGIESLIKRFLVLKTVDGDNEAVFTLTARPSEHIDLIVQNINDGMGNTTNFKKGTVEGTENVVIEYAGKYCDEALKELAEAVGVEWWIEGETVNLCRCEHGEEVTLGYGNGLTSIDRDVADNAKFFTRLFPIGSSRNIDPGHYGSSRLQLPNGEKYVDVNTERYGIIHHYEQEAFSGIYPHRVGVVTDVRFETVTDNDGKPFKIYYFKDNDLPFNPNDYEIGGLVKHVSFVTGELAGLGVDDDHYFEVNYNSGTREFEIITIWPYDNDIQLPGETLIPKIGDRYILWNIRMPDEFYGLAEEAYYKKVNEYIAQHALDVSRYKAPTDHVWIENEGVNLFVGCRIRLESLEYFPDTGYRSSRITRISRQVTLPSQMDLEISDALSTKTLDKIDDNIRDVKNYTGSLVGRMSLPDIIRSWDTTHPTDNNLYSARRSHREFLSKNTADRAKGRIFFDDGIDLGEYEESNGASGGRITKDGEAYLLSLVIRTLLGSPNFTDGFGGEGWQLWIDEKQLANLTIDKLTVRQIMTVFELLVEKIRSVGGQIVVSAANGKIKTVEEVGDYYKITFEQENTFLAHDLMRCQTFTGGNLKSYWVEVASVDGNSILVAKSEFETSLPAEADECVLMGNTTNTMRQNLILISATEDGQPRIDVMDGVHAKDFSNCLRARLGNLNGIRNTVFSEKQPEGYGLYSDNAYLRGTFLLENGDDVKTRFEITEGKIHSSVSALRQDFAQANGYLNNPCFDDGLSKWQTENETVFWLVGNRWIWANNNVLTKKGDGASVTTDDGRVVVRIKNKYITQRNGNLRSIPTMETNAETGKKEAKPVYLSFFYRCTTAGTLRIRFENVDKTGFENFDSIDVEEQIAVTAGYRQYTCDGLWNGTGDFKLSFTGDIYMYMLILSTDKVEALTYKYRGIFEQSAKLTHLANQYLDNNGNLILESGMTVSAQGTGIYARGADGKIAMVGVGVQETYTDEHGEVHTRTVIEQIADHIKLEGLVTANQNFKILNDGSIEAVNGKFRGQVNATSGSIGGFNIGNGKIGAGDENDRSGLFLYDTLIGFNALNRQAIFGTWDNLGQPMLARLVDTSTDYPAFPKYGILFDIRNSTTANLAFAGTGNGALNGFIDGYKFNKVNLTQNNSIYDVALSDSNRIIVNSTASDVGIVLPRLSTVRNALSIGNNTPFAIRLILTSDLGSNSFRIYGRNVKTGSGGDTPWNNEEYPLFTHWDGGQYGNDGLAMGQGDSLEVLLVYDPDRTGNIDGFTTQYTARAINRQD